MWAIFPIPRKWLKYHCTSLSFSLLYSILTFNAIAVWRVIYHSSQIKFALEMASKSDHVLQTASLRSAFSSWHMLIMGCAIRHILYPKQFHVQNLSNSKKPIIWKAYINMPNLTIYSLGQKNTIQKISEIFANTTQADWLSWWKIRYLCFFAAPKKSQLFS